jgi:Baseplate J-like protein
MFFRRRKIVPRSQELVFLDADDDLGTIRSKLESSSAEEIYMVIPRRSSVLRTPLEFRILARIANEMSSETILVTDDSTRRRLAHQEGFRTRRSLRTLRHLMVGPNQRPPRFVIPDWVPLPRLTSLLSLVGLLVVAALGVLVVYPQMRVTLVPQSNSVSRSVDITIDADVRTADPATATLPADILYTDVQVDDNVSIPSDRTVGRDPAHGEVVITSQRPEPTTLAKGTVVRVDGGPRFTIDQDRPVPPSVPVRVGITAIDPGTSGNVPPGQITLFDGNGLDGLEVTNQRATTGGTDRQARVVSDDDVKALRDKLAKDAREHGFSQLQQQAGPEQTLISQTLSVTPILTGQNFNASPGEEAAQLTGSMGAKVSATVFRNLAYNDLVGKVLETSAGTDSRLTAPAEVKTPGFIKIDGRKVVLRSEASGVLARDIDARKIGDALRGSSLKDAYAYLERLSGLAEPPVVEVTPSWAPRAYRVDVNVRAPK